MAEGRPDLGALEIRIGHHPSALIATINQSEQEEYGQNSITSSGLEEAA